MSAAPDTAPQLCAACAARLHAGVAAHYCAHHQVLAVAQIGEAGRPCGFKTFGPLTAAEAAAALDAGGQEGARRFRAVLGGAAQPTPTTH